MSDWKCFSRWDHHVLVTHYVGIIKEKDLGFGPRGTGQPTTEFSLDILRLRLQWGIQAKTRVSIYQPPTMYRDYTTCECVRATMIHNRKSRVLLHLLELNSTGFPGTPCHQHVIEMDTELEKAGLFTDYKKTEHCPAYEKTSNSGPDCLTQAVAFWVRVGILRSYTNFSHHKKLSYGDLMS